MKKYLLASLLALCGYAACYGQSINLNKALKENQLIVAPNHQAVAIEQDGRQGVSCNGIVWLKDTHFTTGTIDVDLKGKDVFQQSFLGIAFHGVDTTNYEAIYFRPFNFQADDKLRKVHQVQYISEPDFGWERLRNEHPLVYENRVIPSLMPTEWFHAHIVVGADEISVFVNNSTEVSLKVKRLTNRPDGLLGLWTFGLNGDFANLVIGK